MNNNISILPLTVTQLNNQVKVSLHQEYQNINVIGEVNNFKKYSSGHAYFILKDKTSEISCVMFNSYFHEIDFNLKNGDKVVLTGDTTLYVPKGNYQFLVKKIDSANEKGDIYKEYEKLKKKLDFEGLFKSSYKKRIPNFPNRIGVVSSLDGSVVKDIINIAKRRSPLVDLLISPSSVQGVDAPKQIIRALEKLLEHNRIDKIDAIIIARGGGSFEDLNCFNSEALARKVFDSEIPIISAIGHETDFTILDFVSDVRASTPSEATEISIPDDNETIQTIDIIINQILSKNIVEINTYKEKFNLLNSSLKEFNPKFLIENYKIKVSNIKDKMIAIQKNIYNNIDNKIMYYNKLLYHNNPYNILNKGFAVISNKKNKVIKKVKGVNLNENINIKFQDGLAIANIKSIESEDEK